MGSVATLSVVSVCGDRDMDGRWTALHADGI